MSNRTRSFLTLVFASFFLISIGVISHNAFAMEVVATIPVGSIPTYLATDPHTNKIYVSNQYSNNISVIDGSTNKVISTIPVGTQPSDIKVNPVTDMVYVGNYHSGTVSVIDGNTDTVVGTISGIVRPWGIAVNPSMNLIYVSGYGNGNSVYIINGTTNTLVQKIQFAYNEIPAQPAANPRTNMVYVPTICSYCPQSYISVIDGHTNTRVMNIPAGHGPNYSDLNPNTNLIYVIDSANNYQIDVINGSSNKMISAITTAWEGPVAVNPNTNLIYTECCIHNTISAINGSDNTIVDQVQVGRESIGIAVNPVTNMIYTANGDNTTSVINGSSSSGTPTTTTAPSSPQNLAATVSTPSQVSLSWTLPSSNGGSSITGYRIERSIDGGANWSTMTSNTGTGGTTFNDTGLSPGATYTYRVSAINSAGSSPPSNTVSATTPSIEVTAGFQACCNGYMRINGHVSNQLAGIDQMQLLVYAPNGNVVLNKTEPTYFQDGYGILSRSEGKGNYTVIVTYDNSLSAKSEVPSWINDDPVVFVTATEKYPGSVYVSGRVDHGLGGEQVSIAIQDPTGATTATYVQTTAIQGQFSQSIDADSAKQVFPINGSYTILVTHLPTGITGQAVLSYITNPTLPDPPTNLAATAVSPSQIDLSWNAPLDTGSGDFLGYYIYRSTDEGSTWYLITSYSRYSTSTTYSDLGPAANIVYSYKVTAVNSYGEGNPSNTVSATTSGNTIASGIVLNNVQSTSGTTSSSNQIALSGFDAGTGSNQLLLVGVSANNNIVASVAFNGTPLKKAASSFSNNDAEFWYMANPSGTGNIIVTMNGATQAVVGAYSFSGVDQTSPITTTTINHNTSAGSPTISITTKYANDMVLDLPSIWGGVTLGSPTCTQQWDANVPNTVTGASSSVLASSSGVVTCKWTASSADFWDDVAVELKAASTSTTTSPTVPSAPTGLVATGGNTQVTLSWTAPSSDGGSAVTGYNVYRGTTAGGEDPTPVASVVTSTTYTDAGLTNGQAYYYTVRAVNSVGTSSPSNEASATPASGSSGTTSITLNNVQSTSGTTSSSNQIILSNFNAGTASNRLLLVGISANNNNVGSITFAGVPLTRAVGSFFNNDAELWYLANPSGTGDIAVTMNGATQAVVGAYSFSGVNQTMPIPTHTVRHNTSAGSPSISVTTKYPNDLVLDLPSIYGGSTLGSPTCTQQWDANVPNTVTGASSTMVVPSPAAVTCKWTASSADFWDDIAVELRAAG